MKFIIKENEFEVALKFLIGTANVIFFAWVILIFSTESDFFFKKELKDHSKHTYPHLVEEIYVLDSNNKPIIHKTLLTHILLILGGIAPFIVGVVLFLSLGFKRSDLFQVFFSFKTSIKMYLLVIVFVFLSHFITFYVGVIIIKRDWFEWLLSIGKAFIFGGLNEFFWHVYLQGNLENKLRQGNESNLLTRLFSFFFSSQLIWLLQTIMYFILSKVKYTDYNELPYYLFSIGLWGLSFSSSLIYSLSHSLFLCIIYQSLNIVTIRFASAKVLPLVEQITAIASVFLSLGIFVLCNRIQLENNKRKEAGEKGDEKKTDEKDDEKKTDEKDVSNENNEGKGKEE